MTTATIEQPLRIVTPARKIQCRTCSRWEVDLVDECCAFCQTELDECPNCFRLNAPDAAECTRCGRELTAEAETDFSADFYRKVDESRELDRDGI